MKIKEVINISQTYLATVNVVPGDSTMTSRISTTPEAVLQVTSILTHIYSDDNVLTINEVMHEDLAVSKATKTLSPQELQVKSLTDKAEDYKRQAKEIKARQQMAKAQQNLMKAQKSL